MSAYCAGVQLRIASYLDIQTHLGSSGVYVAEGWLVGTWL